MKSAPWAWLIGLVLLFFAGDRLGGWGLKRMTDSSQFRYARLYQDKAVSDILLLGNSRGLCFFQPEIEAITGKNTFNLSYNGLPINVANALALDYFDRYPAPELLLIDVTLCDRVNKQVLSEFVLYAPYSKRLQELLQQERPQHYQAAQWMHLFRYNNELFQRTLFYLNDSDEDWLLDRVISTTMKSNVAEQTYSIDTFLVNELVALTEKAREKGIKVNLLINPYYPSFLETMKGLNEFEQQIETATGLEVHNYANALQEASYFGDYQHLNKIGSQAYLKLLFQDGLLTK
ncbi:MAG: hypothetical protein HC892_08780 [Saprospiraceae bacterium]|nr:hypothetical protein [Saprospiraceae bacterium]